MERLYLPLFGQRWELVPTGKLLPAELKELKRVTRLALVPFEQALNDADIDAWAAWIYISIRRVNPHITIPDVERELEQKPLVEVMESIERETPEVVDPVPPDGQAGDASGLTTQPVSTPASSGPQT